MRDRLKEILATMDIPQMRSDITQTQNLRWLQRNLQVRNGAHPNTGEALLIIRDILKD